jgi:hypothetical protein
LLAASTTTRPAARLTIVATTMRAVTASGALPSSACCASWKCVHAGSQLGEHLRITHELADHAERGGEAEPELDDASPFVGAAAQLAGLSRGRGAVLDLRAVRSRCSLRSTAGYRTGVAPQHAGAMDAAAVAADRGGRSRPGLATGCRLGPSNSRDRRPDSDCAPSRPRWPRRVEPDVVPAGV